MIFFKIREFIDVPCQREVRPNPVGLVLTEGVNPNTYRHAQRDYHTRGPRERTMRRSEQKAGDGFSGQSTCHTRVRT